MAMATKCPRCEGYVHSPSDEEPHCLRCGWVEYPPPPERPYRDPRPCADCGEDISERPSHARYCINCAIARDQLRKDAMSAKYRAERAAMGKVVRPRRKGTGLTFGWQHRKEKHE